MSYWKKALSIGLAAVMTASMLAGCGGSSKDTAQSGGGILRVHRLRILPVRMAMRQQIIQHPVKFPPILSQRCVGRTHGLPIFWKAVI